MAKASRAQHEAFQELLTAARAFFVTGVAQANKVVPMGEDGGQDSEALMTLAIKLQPKLACYLCVKAIEFMSEEMAADGSMSITRSGEGRQP